MSLDYRTTLSEPHYTTNPYIDFTPQNLDPTLLFNEIIGYDDIKKFITTAIMATDPIHTMLVGSAGIGKTSFLMSILKIFQLQSLFIDSTISSGIGMIESIFDMEHRLKYLLVDEIEKFTKKDRNTLLNLLETGTISRRLKGEKRILVGMKVWLIATCNDIKKMQAEEKPLMNRCETLEVPAVTYDVFEHIASIRLRREKGINEEIARYIAFKTYSEYDNQTNMRRAVRLSRLSNSHAQLEEKPLTKDIVDETIGWIKAHRYILDKD